MQDRLHSQRLTRLPRARLLARAMLLSGVLVAGCGGSSHSPTAATSAAATGTGTTTTTTVATGPTTTTTVATGAGPSGAASSGAALFLGAGPLLLPHQFRVAYGIQPLLDRGIDGRGETVTVLVPVPQPDEGPTDIRQDLGSFDSMFRLPAARIEVVTSLAGSASPWQATDEEVGDTEFVHAVAPAATLRGGSVSLQLGSKRRERDRGHARRVSLVVAHTDVASISWSLGEHYWPRLRWPRCTRYCWRRRLITSR